MKLTARDICHHLDGRPVLAGVDLDVPEGAAVALVGANGSGKSTLLRLLYRALSPQVGAAWIGEHHLWQMPRRSAARLVGAVPQEQPADVELTVGDLVALGRLPHQRGFAADGPDDIAAVQKALAATGVTHLAGRRLDQVSGGERQRAVVARALAQDPAVLLLDEPTNHLDLRHQHDLLALVASLGRSTVVALHDLNLAAAYCDHVVVLRDGHVLATGSVHDVLQPDLVFDAFGVRATRIDDPDSGRPQLLFHRTRPDPKRHRTVAQNVSPS